MGDRNPSLDAFRGLAVLFMLEVHLGFWWARAVPPGDPLVALGTVLGGTAAPVFLILGGVGLSLSRERRPGGFVERAARRAAALFLAGILFTFVEQAVYGPWGWGVLQCIGVSLVLGALAMGLPAGARAIAGISLMAAAPFLRSLLGIPGVLYSDQMMAVGSAGDYAQRALLSGFFPLLPWTGLLILGSCAGDWLFRGGREPRKAVYLSLFLMLVGFGALARGTPLEFFPPSLSFMFLASGFCLLAIPAFMAMEFSKAGWLPSLGRISLTVFIAHHLIGYETFRAFGLLNKFDIPAALAMVLLAWALALVAARAWSRVGFRFSLEWFLGRTERRPSG